MIQEFTILVSTTPRKKPILFISDIGLIELEELQLQLDTTLNLQVDILRVSPVKTRYTMPIVVNPLYVNPTRMWYLFNVTAAKQVSCPI